MTPPAKEPITLVKEEPVVQENDTGVVEEKQAKLEFIETKEEPVEEEMVEKE